METKKCILCDNLLPIDSFHKHPKMKDGRVNKCKSCTKLCYFTNLQPMWGEENIRKSNKII